MDPPSALREFSAYGPSHWVVLAVFTAGAALVVRIGRKHRSPEGERRFGRVAGGATLLLYLAIYFSAMVPPTLGRSVPLRLTDLATMVAAYALWSHRRWAYALTYYWCLTLSTQALVSPALDGPDFPNPEFLAFWAIHLVVVWAAIYLTWGIGMRPDWRSYWLAVIVTVVWVAVTFVFNSIAGTNYGFVNGKPTTPSLLDVLGPWPWYLVTVALLLLAVWAAMTWPWTRRSRAERPHRSAH
ncbi:TIGR02206 family membrane protein [Nocardia abscessus]|uniref:TIGR02206 family membrane protein n=1 Tax=Nocardia abscessus TaxID=120957 RepID=A0ABS0CE76_9NOCA|nr:TIGR02206 family membrane protein [Nocardia abscessus]MBF6228649.1 TIGR02206 family membrane protein [Nocardia abscessus]